MTRAELDDATKKAETLLRAWFDKDDKQAEWFISQMMVSAEIANRRLFGDRGTPEGFSFTLWDDIKDTYRIWREIRRARP